MILELLPYQELGAAHLADHPRCGLFDEMGVGKSCQAIRAMDMVGAERILVVCPAAVRETWVGEFAKFAHQPRRVLKGSTPEHLTLWLRNRVDVLIVSYDMAVKWAPYIDDLIDVIVLDESHYLKSTDAERTKALLGPKVDGKGGLAKWAARLWFLTGTPIPNDVLDIWPFLKSTGATLLSKDGFRKRYLASRMGSWSIQTTPLADQVGELRQVIRAVSLRRTAAEVQPNLPPIWLTTQTVEGDTDEIRQLLREQPGLEKAVLEAVEKGGLSFLDAQHIATLRRLVGEAKAPSFVELVREELSNGDHKVVIMGIHKAALKTIRDGLTRYGFDNVHVDGAVGEADRVQAVDTFQRDPGTRCFTGNIRAAGTGLTLTAASNVIMFESDWSPAGNAQAIKRIHRHGQTQDCHARFISLANSIDDKVTAVVARKTAAIARAGFNMVAA